MCASGWPSPEEDSAWTFVRHFRVGTSTRTLWLVLGSKPADVSLGISGKGGAPLPANVALEKYPDTRHRRRDGVGGARAAPP